MYGYKIWVKRNKTQTFLLTFLSLICTLLWLTESPVTILRMESLPRVLQSFTPLEAEVEAKKREPFISINPRIWLKYNGQTWRGLQLPVITAEPSGRLGNMMGEYATLYGIGRAYNATVRLHPHVDGSLKSIFPNLSIPLIPGDYNPEEWKRIVHVASSSYGGIEVAAAGLFGPRLIAATGSHMEMQLFNAYREDVIKEFTFSTDIQHKVEDFWRNVSRSEAAASVYVGFHIRRTDYASFLQYGYKSKLPGHLYFWNAMNYYRNKFSDVLFIVASDDLGYARSALANYTDVIYAPGTSGNEDLAILASCNHSIITVGSYGFWSGYLAGGFVVYPNITVQENYLFYRKYYELAGLDFFILVESD